METPLWRVGARAALPLLLLCLCWTAGSSGSERTIQYPLLMPNIRPLQVSRS